MRWVSLIVVAGCGRVAFDPLAATDGVTDINEDGSPPACLTDPAYVTVAGLPHRYREGVPKVSWATARAMCQAEGADLWIPRSFLELTTFAGDWVGITDEAVESTWVTVEGVPATFLPWEQGQPDGGLDENCARSTSALLEDRDCADLRDFVCECAALGSARD